MFEYRVNTRKRATLNKYCMTNSKFHYHTGQSTEPCLLLFLSTLGGTGGGAGGGDRPADIKDVLDLENLRLSDHTNKASKTQVTV